MLLLGVVHVSVDKTVHPQCLSCAVFTIATHHSSSFRSCVDPFPIHSRWYENHYGWLSSLG